MNDHEFALTFLMATPEQRLTLFVQRVQAGEAISQVELSFVAKGIARSLSCGNTDAWQPEAEKRKKGRPEVEGYSAEEWANAAAVQFYRRILPKACGDKPVPQPVFAKRFNREVSKVKRLQKLDPLDYPKDENGQVFYEVIDELIRRSGLPEGAWYCRITRAIRRPMVRSGQKTSGTKMG